MDIAELSGWLTADWPVWPARHASSMSHPKAAAQHGAAPPAHAASSATKGAQGSPPPPLSRSPSSRQGSPGEKPGTASGGWRSPSPRRLPTWKDYMAEYRAAHGGPTSPTYYDMASLERRALGPLGLVDVTAAADARVRVRRAARHTHRRGDAARAHQPAAEQSGASPQQLAPLTPWPSSSSASPSTLAGAPGTTRAGAAGVLTAVASQSASVASSTGSPPVTRPASRGPGARSPALQPLAYSPRPKGMPYSYSLRKLQRAARELTTPRGVEVSPRSWEHQQSCPPKWPYSSPPPSRGRQALGASMSLPALRRW